MNELNAITDEQYWNLRWEKYRRFQRIFKWDKIWGAKGSFLRIMRKYLGNLNGMKVLELGGAASYLSISLAKWGKSDVTLVDYSSEGLKITEKIYKINNCDVKIIQKDFFNWDTDEKFDTVVHWGLLEHFKDPVPILKVCYKFLKPGGKVVFSMPNMEAVGSVLWKKLNLQDWNRHIYHSVNAIQEACDIAGLEFVDKFYWGPPLIQISPCKKNEYLKKALLYIQYGFILTGMLFPLYHHGSSKISTHRGFILYKPV